VPTRIIICLRFIVLFAVSSPAHSLDLRVNQTAHPLDAYAVGALKIALRNSPSAHKVIINTADINQTRAIEMLKSGDMEVMWLASNQDVESDLRPIRFPLLKGLLGHRICIINPKSQAKFSSIQSFSDLQAFSFGQGQGWPDVEILRNNNMTVVTTSKYDNLFYMVEGNRFDGFPRGVLEPWVEIEAHPNLRLAVEKHVVIVYKLPFYLFVHPNNATLAAEIKLGLDTALANGDFDEYFYNNPLVKDALTRSQLKERLAFPLNNPFLSPQTPPADSHYWLKLEDL